MNLNQIFISSLLLMTVQLFAQEQPDTLSKFDFVTGDKIIFFDNFSNAQAGNFAVQWRTNSSGAVVTSPNYTGKWFQLNKAGYFMPEVKEKFTDNFTIEFDLVPLNAANNAYFSGMTFQIVAGTLNNPFEEKSTPGMAGIGINFNSEQINWANWSETDEGFKENGSIGFKFNSEEKYHVSIWVQKQSLRIYANKKKIVDLPEGLVEGYNYNIFRIQTTEEIKPLITNFTMATGFPDKKNKQ